MRMINYIWPLVLILLSNTMYQICAKSVPNSMNPFASLTISYTVSALLSLGMYFLLTKDSNLIREYKEVNWAPFVLGIAIVGLEVGYIYAYKAGWAVSTCQIIQAAILAIILIFVGYFLYKEGITWNKIVGIAICLVGMGLIGWK